MFTACRLRAHHEVDDLLQGEAMFHSVVSNKLCVAPGDAVDTQVVFYSITTEYLQVTAGLATDKPGIYVIRVFLLSEPGDLDRMVGEGELKRILHVQRMELDPNAFFGHRLSRVKAVRSKKIRKVVHHQYEHEDGHFSWSDPDIPRFIDGELIYQDASEEVGVHVRF